MAYLASLSRLKSNVRKELDYLRRLAVCEGSCPMCEAFTRIEEHLDADAAEVRADVEQLIETGQF